ncbi:hypothetical protein D3C84_758020 [compost metagenome]
MATVQTVTCQAGAARFTKVGPGGVVESAVCATHTTSLLLHAFKKTTRKVGKRDKNLVKDRLKSLGQQDINSHPSTNEVVAL